MKDVEIGTLGETKCYMKLDELFRIANNEVQDFADNVCRDNSRLQYQLDLVVKALNKILKRAKEVREKDGLSEYARRVCQNVLKEIEK
jgi:hypothetical protein